MPKLSALPKATLVATLEALAERNDEVRAALARLTEDEADRVKSIKKGIAGFRRRNKFVPYYEQRPVYQQLERLATSIKEDISDPTTGVELALLAYALDDKLPYLLDGSDGNIGNFFDHDLKPAFVHHARQHPERNEFLKTLIPFANNCKYGFRQNLWENAQEYLSHEEISALLEPSNAQTAALPKIKEAYRRDLAKSTGDPERFKQAVADLIDSRPDLQLELAQLYMNNNQFVQAIEQLQPLTQTYTPYTYTARQLLFDAYRKTQQTAKAEEIVEIWLQSTHDVAGLHQLINKVGEEYRDKLTANFLNRLLNESHPVASTALALLDLGMPDKAIQLFHRADLAASDRASLTALVKRWSTPDNALEASLCLRRLVEESLDYANSKYYATAARNLDRAQTLAGEIGSFAQYSTHEEWVAGLRKSHGRKKGFWSKVK